MKKVSIIIACRNEEEFLHKCLLSLLKQDYPQELIEIIVVDGMSTDKTWAVADYFREMYPNVRIDVNPNKFKYYGLNEALKYAKGDYIAIADAHSVYPKNYVSELAGRLDTLPVDNVGGGRIFEPRSNSSLSKALTFALTLPFSLFK